MNNRIINKIAIAIIVIAATLGIAMAGGLVRWQGISNFFKGDDTAKTAETKAKVEAAAKPSHNANYAHTTAFSGMPFALSVEGCSVTGEAGSMDGTSEIEIMAIDSLPPLAAGMVNVTRGHAGYRLSPAGLRFARPVSVELGYDSLLLPKGHSSKEIRTFLYNSEKRHWEALPRDSVMEGSQNIVSQSKQAGEMINAIVQLPELPESKAFTPTMLTELEAAHPATGITMMEPPAANSQGTANLSYPITVPAGRNGLQPNLSVSYSSEAGNGLLGMGWDMQLPAITVDSKWGVPRYDDDYETECYSYNGQELLPSPRQRNGFIPRQPERRFHPRVEGGFDSIVRHGTGPKNYWWEVTDKGGTRHFYGSYDGSSCDTSVLMSDSCGNIGHWPLCVVTDINGNSMRYNYSKCHQYSEYQQDYPATSPLQDAPPVYLGQQLWPESIQYGAHGGDTGRYRVVFCSDAVSRDSAYRRSCAPRVSVNRSTGSPATVGDTSRKRTVRGEEDMGWDDVQAVEGSDPNAPADAPCSAGSIPVTICIESPCAQNMNFAGANAGIGRTRPEFADGTNDRYPVTFNYAANGYQLGSNNGGGCFSFTVCPEVTYHAVVQPPSICGDDPVSFTFRIGGNNALTVNGGNGIPMIGAEVTVTGHTIHVPVECDCNIPNTCYDCGPGEGCDNCPPIYRKKIYIGVQDNFCELGRLPHCLFTLTRVSDPLQTEYHYTTGYPRIQPVEVRENEPYHVHGYWFGGRYQQSPVDFIFSVNSSGCVTVSNESGILSITDPHILVNDYCNSNGNYIEMLMPVVPEPQQVRVRMTDDGGRGVSGCRLLAGRMTDNSVAGLYATDMDGYTPVLQLDQDVPYCIGETEYRSVTGDPDYHDLLADWPDAVRLYLKGGMCWLKRGSLSTPADSVRYRDGVYTFHYTVTPMTSWKETTVRVRKSDSASGLPLEGALFGYGRRCDGNGVLGTVLTDADGSSSGIPLRCGVTYRVRELFPPAGYRRSSPAYAVVRCDADGNLQVLESRHLRGCTQNGDVWTLDFSNVMWLEPSRPFPSVSGISCDSYAYDNTVGVRNGYRQSSKEKLLRIMVYYRDSCVRSYEFCYGQDRFGRARLASAREYGADPQLGCREHRLDYYGDDAERQMFGQPCTTGVDIRPTDAALLPLLPDPLLYLTANALEQPTLLGGSRTIGTGISAGASLGLFPDFPLRTLSAGVNANGSFSTGKGRTSLTDINGDGLPDLVYDSIRPFVRLQRSDGTFGGHPYAVGGYQSFLRDYSDNVGLGPQVSSVVSGSVQRGWANSWTSNYLADMDGDGLVDLVTPRNVLHPFRPQTPPKYAFEDCLPPQASLVADTVRVLCDDRFSFSDVPYERDRSDEVRYDLVRVWEAELDNNQLQDLTYSVCAPVRLAYDSIAMENFCGDADSVIVSIEYYGTGLTGSPAHLLLWSDVIGDSDTLPHGPDHCSAIPGGDGSCLLRVHKVDMNGLPLEGAQFMTDGNVTVTTDAGGYSSLLELPNPGEVTLREVFSPCGDMPDNNEIRVQVHEGYSVAVTTENFGQGDVSVATTAIGGRTVHTVTVTNNCEMGRGVPRSISGREYTNPAYDLSALPLAKGDRLYFRLRPQDNGVRKKALWNPSVMPHSAVLSASGGLDENGRLLGGGDRASESQLLQGDSIFSCPAKGRIGIESVIPQPGVPLSDSVRFEIWHGASMLDHHTVESGQTPAEHRFVKYLSVDSLDRLKFVVRCRSNVDMTLLHWTPKVYYISIDTGNGSVPTVTTNSAGDSVRLMEYAVAPWHAFYPHISVPGGTVCHDLYDSQSNANPLQRSITSIQVTSASSAGGGWLTVKQEGVRVYAQHVDFSVNPTAVAANVMLANEPGKPVYISLYVDNPASGVTGCTVTIDGVALPAVIYARRANDILTGSHYGGWGQFQYRTGPLPDNDPLSLMDIGRLRTLHRITAQNVRQYADTTALGRNLDSVECFSRSVSFDRRLAAIRDTLHCLPMNNDAVYHGHSGFYANTFIRGAAMNLGGMPCPGFLREAEEAAAFCPQEQEDPQPEEPQRGLPPSTPTRGLAVSNVLSGRSSMKKSRSTTTSTSSGASLVGFGYGKNSSNTATFQERDLTDLNGDGFPDLIVKDTGVWYSFPAASLWESSPRDPFHGEAHHYSVSTGGGENYSADFATLHALTKNSGKGDHVMTDAPDKSQSSTPSPDPGQPDNPILPNMSKSSNNLKDVTIWTLTDINGDGLPDLLHTNDSVALNSGYGFQAKECWNIGRIGFSRSDAFSSSAGVSLGGGKFTGGDRSYSGGVSGSLSMNRSEEMLADLNGDGRPDRVVILPEQYKIYVFYNTGCGFNGYYDSIVVSGNNLCRWTTTRSLSANFGLTLGFPVGAWAKVSASGGADVSFSLSASIIQFMDMDGDGYADLVISPDDHTLYVRYSALGRTGLLKTVTNPLGGSITLGYRQTEANVFHSRRWVMDTLLVCDSLQGDGEDTRMTTWAYEDGYYDRTEREFLGFAKVTERHHGNSPSRTIKRTYTRYFRNDSIHTKGLMLCEEIRNGGDSLYVVTANRYGSRTLTRDGNSSLFVTLDAATVCYYEGGTTAHIRRHSTFDYETAYGNLVRQTETSTDQPLVAVEVSYHADPGNYRVSVPKCVEVAGCKRRTTEIDNMGRITAFRDYYDNSHSLTTRLQYDYYGNVITMRGPNTTVHYTYDNYVHTYPTAITDTFGITSQMQDYDFRFGVPRTIVDQAGSRMEYTIDEWGRTVTVRGPKEIAANVPFTIRYTYAGKDAACRVSTAMTEHYDAQHPNNPIRTYTYCDGLGRIVQTRKETEIGGVEKLIVSGHTVVDALGRTVASHYPTEKNLTDVLFAFDPDQSAPASTVTYDVLDRPLVQTAPDASTSTFIYGFAYNNDLGKMLFSTTTTDANNHSSIELKDVSGKPWVIHPAGQQPVHFDYNSVGDNTSVYSSVTNDWERTYTYDWLGRRLTYVEGELAESYTYNGGNLSTHTQSWLENGITQSKTTTYHYNAHRLDSVSYDDALSTIYHYDQYGRVDSLYDESGVMCYEYGNMGEVTRETRVYALPFLTNALALSTQFTYDSWGRILNITYPDNEVVSYAYDLGGQLQSITNNSSYTYLNNVTYDRFGAKVSQTYGNGLVTDYTYENLTRRLSQISVTDNSSNPYSDIQYGYDPVGNVIQANSNCPWYPAQGFMEIFTYDASDQLTSATESQSQSYQLAVTYGNWGKINSYNLTQTDLQNNTSQSESQGYTYPATNSIGSSQTLFAPVSRTIQGGQHPHSVQSFTFGINGSLRKREIQFPVSSQNTEYYLFNSAANLKAYSNNGIDFAYYGYNASNTRTYKLSMLNMGQWVNGHPHPIHPQIQQAMFYPNAYINFNQNGEYTKHYYNGTERIASRLGNATMNIAATANARLNTRSTQLEDCFRNDIRTLVYAGDIPMDMPLEPVSATSLQQTGTPTDIFYYHTNHLGSTAFVTDQNQTITQGFLYAPFGEITTEYNATFGNDVIPKYSFNAKELDEETGMYYYEARYYKPPVFTSRDPMMDSIPYFSPYSYCVNNPLKYTDLNGNIPILIPIVWGAVELGLAIYDTYTAYQTVKDQNASTLDKSLAITGVLCSAVLPGGGYGVGLKMTKKTVFKIGEKTIDKASDYYRATKMMSPEERVATYKRTAADVAKKEGWIKNKALSKKNGRDIYTSKDGKYHFSLDTENGHFEVLDKRGKHQGSIDFEGAPTKPRDNKSRHNITI